MGWKESDQYQIVATATENADGHLTFTNAPKADIAFESKTTCGKTWKIDQVYIEDSATGFAPVQAPWLSAAVSTVGTVRVKGYLKFDFAAFNLSSLADRTRWENAWRNGTRMKVRINFIDKDDLGSLYLKLAKPPAAPA